MVHRTIEVRAEAGLLRIALARPERRNGIDDVVIGELNAALDVAEADPDCRAVVLRGSPGVFSDGMNLEAAAGGGASDGGKAFFGLLERFTTIPRVVVVQVDGQVAGGGVGLVAAGDFVHATERSTFALPEALWGLLPCCVLPFLVRRVGFQKAYTATLSTQAVSAREAHRIHLVDELTEQPETALRQLVFRLTRLDGVVIGDAKRYFRGLSVVDARAGENAVAEFSRLMSSPVVRQRISDFVTHKRFPWER
ncbi:polyketide biosynthesis enoyl-CoA hydratase PksH [Saccharothrix tamanrassetensis]|uniref:Polyketide biosynthesis enoyl-CoA hydratase PksH n=1 Tax=Saccharothrix tamanrassetensis TaxID=1051531 RepID=A0A841CC77_9PSEU|nr:enoyl-CoA hydratase-related protein [Saccharothrix tamanrassetensis]MBB5953778.1 polyketide biosynthesis enoyl-CoA hydratase PksH [Saccharothrix tamanrassetensis]